MQEEKAPPADDNFTVAVVSRVVVERVVKCPFGVAHEYAQQYLEGAEREITIKVPLRDFIRSLPRQSHKPVKLVFALHPDETETGRGHDAMLVEWHAGTRLFPNFHGTLRLRIDTVDSTRLTFEGAYRAPLGGLGRAFDAVVGKAIARATMWQLLHRIGDALERREAEFTAAQGRRAS